MPADTKPAKNKIQEVSLQTLVRQAHAAPRDDLRTLPWIPVHTRDGTPSRLGLRETLLRAHELADIAEPDPLTRAALRRFLTALAARLLRCCGADQEDWQQRLRANTGFTAAEVDALMDDQAEHLWLYHPSTPFLQDPRLLDAMLNPTLMPVSELVVHLPGATEAAWFTKRTDPGAWTRLDAAQTARTLVTRWFYVLNGNSAEVAVPGGKVSSQAGSVFGDGLARLTHVFRVSDQSLFVTLLRNLTSDVADHPVGDKPAWMDSQRPSAMATPLYAYTFTATAALLGARDELGNVTSVLRGPVPAPAFQVVEMRDAARGLDPHRVLIQGRRSDETAVLRLDVSGHRLSNLNLLRRPGWQGDSHRLAHGVVTESRLWLTTGRRQRHAETLELLLAAKSSTGSAPKWAHTATVALPAMILDPDLADLDGILEKCFGRAGLQWSLEQAIRHTLERRDQNGQPAPGRVTDPPIRAATDTALRIWLDAADTAVEKVRTGQSTEAEAAEEIRLDARDALGTATAPYRQTVRYAASAITAQRFLRRPA